MRAFVRIKHISSGQHSFIGKVLLFCSCGFTLIFLLCLCPSLSYVVNMGLIDKLYSCFLSVQGPVDESPKMSAFLQQATALLHAMCKLCFAVTGR